MKKNIILGGVLFLLFLSQCSVLKTEAASLAETTRPAGVSAPERLSGTIYDSPYVAFSPDGGAWTFREPLSTGSVAGRPDYWYADGETITTGISSGLRSPEEGEHYYSPRRTGMIPVGRWEVRHPHAMCIHRGPVEGYHGINYRRECCLAPYFSGWIAYCADCGQPVAHVFLYGSKDAVASVCYIDNGLDYYYCCPSCSHLEQGSAMQHQCRAVSYNMYRVVYDGNGSYMDKEVRGYMPDSCHVYNNETFYEGNEIVPNTCLTVNGYDMSGYTFVGWNDRPDGSGTFYEDGAEILNLSTENYDVTTGKGRVVLYAQWEVTESNLRIDPNGGIFRGSKETVEFRQAYGTSYVLRSEELIPPEGFSVVFESNGGGSFAERKGQNVLREWRLLQPSVGTFEGERYVFGGPMDHTDTLQAVYDVEPVVLPTPCKTNFAFGGWFGNPECTDFVGEGGDDYIPCADVTLYAKWVELQLEVEEVYYRDHALQDWRTTGSIYGAVKGKSGESDNAYATPDDERAVLHATGAVDLRIRQEDNGEKTFQIWMSDETDVDVLNAAYESMKTAERSESVDQTVWKKVMNDGTTGFVVAGIPARDMARPDKVSEVALDVEDGAVVVSWRAPKGNASVVRFFCESYCRRGDGMEKMLTSNILSGKIDTAIAGYYYICNEDDEDSGDYLRKKVSVAGLLDERASEDAYIYEDRNAALFSDEIGFTKDCRLDAEDVGRQGNLAYDPGTAYVHVAAVDVAGNVSDTVLVRSRGAGFPWEPETDFLFLSSVVGGIDRENVVAAEDGRTWYVRADGQTPFLLSYQSRLRGAAREDYQINCQILDARTESGTNQRYCVELPLTVPVDSGGALDSREFARKSLGEPILQESAPVEASREKGAAEVSFSGAFTLNGAVNGQRIVVTPVAGAGYREGTVYSDWAQDCLHSLTLVADGQGPLISGLDGLEDGCVIDRLSEEIELEVSAKDNLSGVSDFYVKVINTDNFCKRIFTAENGSVRLKLTEEDPLFTGNFTVTAYARDGVGNVTRESRQVTEFALETRIERILEPHVPVFKGGESGILTVITYGYADQVEIVFPEGITARKPELNQSIDYTGRRSYRQEARVQFMVPLYVPGGLNQEVTVRAYKDGRKLEDHPTFSTTEAEGNVLGEVRTRLR